MNDSKTSTPGLRWICLTGFMGSGKTTVGAQLATLLRWPFVDLDAEIVRHEGQTIAEIFRTAGEPRFREMEHDTLQRVLRGAGPAVIALGGGTFVQPQNREILRACGARTVYLECEFELLLCRCGLEQGTRPLMQNMERFQKLFTARQPVYQMAELTVAAGEKPADKIASEIARVVATWTETPAVSE